LSRREAQGPGDVNVATFSGGAIRYAHREYEAYDEIELEPYVRADDPR